MSNITTINFLDPVSFSPARAQSGGLPWWAWLLLIIAVALILWWWWKRSQKKDETPTRIDPMTVKPSTPQASTSVNVVPLAPVQPAPLTPPAPVTPDDLTVIEGIGPKIAATLQAAGIKTFTQLAVADPAQVTKILRDAELHLADPSTWGQQAKLAAEGKLDELKTLQDNLKGGRTL